MSQIKTYRLATLEFNEELNLLTFTVKQDISIEVNEILEMIAYVEDFVGPKQHYGIIDFGSSVNSSNEARKTYAESEYLLKYRLADAFIVENLALKLIANFFINVTKPIIKTKSFTGKVEALKWIESLKKEE